MLSHQIFRATRAIILIALGAAAILSCVGAQARDRGVKPSLPRANDFYATTEEPAERSNASYSGGCFTTNSATEAARGIRHWRGGC